MKYTVWIDNKPEGPLDIGQLANLFIEGVITRDTQIQGDSGDQAEAWTSFGNLFPSIASIPTRTDVIQILSAELRSTKASSSTHPQSVIVTDSDMKFWSMYNFMVRWTFASIAAAVVVALVLAILYFILRRFIR